MRWVWLGLGFGSLGCRDHAAEFERWVRHHNSCEVVEDCVVIEPGCPLRCYEAVNAAHVDEAYRQAREARRHYQKCWYDCVWMAELVCDDGTCRIWPCVEDSGYPSQCPSDY